MEILIYISYISYLIGLVVGVGLTMFIFYLLGKRNLKNNQKQLQSYQEYIIQLKKVKDLYSIHLS